MADLALKTTEIFELATDIVKSLSSLLGVVGPLATTIMSVVGMFMPKQDSPELQAIKALWTFVAERFQQLEAKIQNAVEEFEAHHVIIDWQQVS